MGKYSMEIVELLHEQLKVHEQNLAKLELQAARHGMDVPLALQNQIDFEMQKIEDLRGRLARAEARPGAAEEEAAVPLWQKLPAWAWVGIVVVVLLAGAALVFWDEIWSGLKPTPTVVAEATTPAVAEAPTLPALAPTATPVPSTSTPTSTPLPTATPVPTNTLRPTATLVPPTATPTRTPRPTSTPTATIDADPTVYDNFNNPANDGSFDKSQWRYWSDPPNQIAQQDGILTVTQEGRLDNTELAARRYDDFTLNNPIFSEAKLMLSPDKYEGSVSIKFSAALPGGNGWFSSCGIGGYSGANCFDRPSPEQEGHRYQTEGKPVDLGTWHTFRIEVDPPTMTFTYYFDGQMVGSHVPVDAKELKKARFTLAIGVYGEEVTGYIDDVRVGPVQ